MCAFIEMLHFLMNLLWERPCDIINVTSTLTKVIAIGTDIADMLEIGMCVCRY